MGLSPFRGFWDMQSQMDRMFNEMLGNVGRSPARQLEGMTEWAPAVDATEKNGDLIIRAELPGVRPEDVDISLHENVLTISGERKAEQEEERGGYFISFYKRNLPSLLRAKGERIPLRALHRTQTHSSKLARSDVYARWTFLAANFGEYPFHALR